MKEHLVKTTQSSDICCHGLKYGIYIDLFYSQQLHCIVNDSVTSLPHCLFTLQRYDAKAPYFRYFRQPVNHIHEI